MTVRSIQYILWKSWYPHIIPRYYSCYFFNASIDKITATVCKYPQTRHAHVFFLYFPLQQAVLLVQKLGINLILQL
jgi:hypothetical protein